MAVTQEEVLKPYVINKKFVEVGDSIIENGIITTTTAVRRHQRGMMSYLMAEEPFALMHQNTPSGGDYDAAGHNVGEGGTFTHEMLAKFQADAIAKKAGIIRISGGTNDFNNDVPWEGVAANLQQKVNDAVAQGALVLFDNVRPRSDYNGRVLGGSSKDFSAARELEMLAFNVWHLAFCAKHDRVIPMDVYGVHNDGNGKMKDSNTYDGLHINGVGAYAEKQLYVAKLKELGIIDQNNYGWVQPSAYDASDNPMGNLLAAADFSASGGSIGSGAAGEAPSGWTVDRSDGAADTVTASLQDEVGLDGVIHPTVTLNLDLDGAGSDEATSYRMYTAKITNGVESGKQYEFFSEFELESSVGIRSVRVRLLDRTSGGVDSRHFDTAYNYTDAPTDEQVNLPQVPLKGVLYPNPITTIGSEGLQILIYIEVDETVEQTVQLKLRKPVLRQNPTDRLFA